MARQLSENNESLNRICTPLYTDLSYNYGLELYLKVRQEVHTSLIKFISH